MKFNPGDRVTYYPASAAMSEQPHYPAVVLQPRPKRLKVMVRLSGEDRELEVPGKRVQEFLDGVFWQPTATEATRCAALRTEPAAPIAPLEFREAGE